MTGGLEGLLAGRTLVGRYEIGEVIGRGGFAVVYRAMDTRLGRPVAVKVITLTAHDDEAREELRRRLHREARAAAGLPHHPNLVTVHDVGTDPELGLDFLVMELLQGENLSEYLAREGKPPLEQALGILRGAAEGVAVGHRAGLVHRDVKPGNLFLAAPHGEETGPHRVCVLDYGIAQVMEEDATMTRGDASPLSPAFASPEQLRGERELAPASDVFSLGVVGYQLLTGERPFATAPGQAPVGWTVRRPLREANPDVAPEVEAVVMRAMREDPAERFPDADAFADALDAAGAGAASVLPGGAVAAVAAEDDDHTVLAPPPPAPMLQQRTVPPQRGRRSAWPVALVLALLVAAAAAWAALSGAFGGGASPSAAVPSDTAGAPPAVAADPPPVDERTLDLPPPEPAEPPAGDEPVLEEPDAPTDPAGPAPQQPSVPQPPSAAEPAPQQPRQPQPQQPQQPQRPPAREPQPRPSQPQPAQPQPQQPPDEPPPASEPPPQPVIVEPRPAPRDTIRIAPPR
jgi:eukaryotic-like serine/threonine-protein kinase